MSANRVAGWSAVVMGSLFAASSALAGDYYVTVPFLPTVSIGANGTGATPVNQTFGKEYSNTNWMEVFLTGGDPNLVNVGDHDAFAGPDPGQIVSWDGLAGGSDGNSGSVNGFDFPVEKLKGTGQIDAIANRQDLLFNQVIDNVASLLFSVTGDLGAASKLPDAPVYRDRVHWEDPTGGHGTWAGIEAPSAGTGAGPGVNHHPVQDLDGLEVWGPEPPSHTGKDTNVREGYVGTANTADADRFSMDNDFATGTSVFAYDIQSRIVSSFISHQVIVSAVSALFGAGETLASITQTMIDVDATMVRDVGVVGRWDAGDGLLFSLDPIAEVLDVTGALLGTIDGGEIMVLRNSGGGLFSIDFLEHGGHVWDTDFEVAETFGYLFEDIDALEAVGVLEGGDMDIPTPEPGVLALFGLSGAAGLRRRRRA